MATTTFRKRELDTKRREKAKEKEQKRAERAAGKTPRELGPGGEDPDIAGIIPGPQPLPYEDDE